MLEQAPRLGISKPEIYLDNPVEDPTALTNSFEFWPAWTIHLPMALYGLYHGILAGNLSFFSATNPRMQNGGLFNYSKFDAIRDFHPKNIPKTWVSSPPHSVSSLLHQAKAQGIQFPFILKPDIGERGRGVKLIQNPNEVERYLETFYGEVIILQEFIIKREEYGVFIHKNPLTGAFRISSITQKIPLQVLGNGVDTVRILAEKHPRVSRYLTEIPAEFLDQVPPLNRIFQLSIKGNHCKGAIFIDRSRLITPEVTKAFKEICQPVEAFCYGRLDIKVDSAACLSNPASVSILEINGTNAEPIHIYSPGNSYLKSLQIIGEYFTEMAQIAKINLKLTQEKPRLANLIRSFSSYQKLKKNTHE